MKLPLPRLFTTGFVVASLVATCGFAQDPTLVQGLKGDYRFRLSTIVSDPFGGAADTSRIDPEVNVVFNKDNPAPVRSQLWWSVRWTGSLVPPATGDYVFRMRADEYARVIVDGRILMSSFDQAPLTEHTSQPVKLTGAQAADIVVELVNRLGETSLALEWKTPGAFDFKPLPGSALRPERPAYANAVNRIRVLPRAGQAAALVGGKISGSNAGPTRDFKPIATITEAPAEGAWLELKPANNTVYRWVKLEAADGSWGNVAEIEFYHDNQRITGTGFGTTGSRNNSGNTWEKALDGNPATFMEGVNADDQYVGYDLGEAIQVAAPTFSPEPGGQPGPVFVKLRTSTPGALIRYTTNGKEPDEDTGFLYTGEFLVDKDTSLVARAFRPRLAASPAAIAQYAFKVAPLKPGLKTFHTGNSLTENAVSYLVPVAAGLGYKHTVIKHTVPGAPTDFLWEKWGKTPGAAGYLEKSAPIDHYIVQPFPGHNRSVASELQNGGAFYELARQFSPKIQLWVYMQWPVPTFREGWAHGRGPDLQDLKLPPPKTWDDGMRNMARFYEKACEAFRAKYPESNARILPVGLALLNLKQRIDAGKVPGMTDSLAEILTGVHLTAKTEYLAGLVFAACLYGESPVGKAVVPGIGLTEEQARIFQEVAWETVTSYSHYTGVKAAGGK